MLCHIGNVHTEAALSLVDDESTALEDSFLVSIIEITQSDEVAEKSVEIAENIEELCHHIDV